MEYKGIHWSEHERLASGIDEELFYKNWYFVRGGGGSYFQALNILDTEDPKHRRYGHLYDSYAVISSVDVLNNSIQEVQIKPFNPLYYIDGDLKKGESNKESPMYLKATANKIISMASKYGLLDKLPKDKFGDLCKEEISFMTEAEKAHLTYKSGLNEFVKFKPIKYEAMPGKEIPYIIPLLTDNIISKICTKHGLTPPTECFTQADLWLWLTKRIETLWITEGSKKALSLLSQGELAIASFSITTHSQKKKEGAKTSALKKDIQTLLGTRSNLKINIAFDCGDIKASTRKAVKKQNTVLAKKLKKYGEVAIATWSDSDCKGIDDYLAKYKSLDDITITDFREYKSKSLEMFNRHITPDLTIHKRYFPAQIITEQRKKGNIKLVCIKSAQNTGKTTAIKQTLESYLIDRTHADITNCRCFIRSRSHAYGYGKVLFYDSETETMAVAVSSEKGLVDIDKARDPDSVSVETFDKSEVKLLQYQGRFPDELETFCGIHRTTLSKNLSNKLGLRHYQTDGSQGDGDVYCVDSMLQVQDVNSYNNMIIDESSQVAWHCLSSSTEIRKNRVQKINRLGKIGNSVIANNGIITIMDADLDDKTIAFYQLLFKVSKEDTFVVENTFKPFTARKLYTYKDIADLRSQITQALEDKERIIIHTSGQKSSSTHGSLNLEKELKEAFPEFKVLRIDSTTLGDEEHLSFEILDRLYDLSQYDVIIASSSLNTGVDLTEDLVGTIDKVFGIFYGNYPLNDFEQAIERYRGDCERHVFCSTVSNAKIEHGSSSYDDIYKNIMGHSRRIIERYNIEEELVANTIVGHYCQFAITINNDYKNLLDNFIARAKLKGYNHKSGVSISKEARKQKKDLFKEIKEQSTLVHYNNVKKADDLSELEIRQLENKQRKTQKEVDQLEKAMIKKRYNTEEVTDDLLKLNESYSQVLYRYYAQAGTEVTTEIKDMMYLEYLKNTSQELYPPDLNKSIKMPVVETIQKININNVIDVVNNSECKFTNLHAKQVIEQLRKCPETSKTLCEVIKFDVFSEAPYMKLFSSLIKKFGYSLVKDGSKRIDGKCYRTYKMVSELDDKLVLDILKRWELRDAEYISNIYSDDDIDSSDAVKSFNNI